MGDPQVANAETGKVLLDYAIESISNSINEL
jgi:creatinine amidohydrolase/Fe(II)-dependent formamide hydrolase-like protein